MTRTASGTFDVATTPQSGPDAVTPGVKFARMSLHKTFGGDLQATSHGEMLTAMTETPGSAGYVAVEHVTGTLHGKAGSFALQHCGTMARGMQQLSVTVVPDSGTGELAGIGGTMSITIIDGRHFYEMAYSMQD